jgi:transaldolase
MKTFYCAEDIEQLAAQGARQLILDDATILTDLARDASRRLGISLVYRSRGASAAPAAPPPRPASSAEPATRPVAEPAKGGAIKPRVFLDCADVREIEQAMRSGVLSGIATNSSKVAEMGKTVEAVYREIRSIFDGPVAVQAVGGTAEELIRHARQLDGLGPNTVVKIPTTGEGVRAISQLVREGIQTNATLIFRPSQALAAALAGTPIISPFIGRANDMGLDGVETIAKIRKVYDAFGLDPLVIAASVRTVEQVVESIIAGADSVAVRYEIFVEMLNHPLTDVGLAQFMEDTRRSQGGTGAQPYRAAASGGSQAVVDQLVDVVKQLETGDWDR